MAALARSTLAMYLKAVARHWAAVVTGSVPVAVLAVLKLSFPGGEYFWNQTASGWVAGSAVAASVVVAQYLAWRDVTNRCSDLEGELSRLRDERDPVQRALNRLSADALELLTAASQDSTGTVSRIVAQVVIIRTTGRVFTDSWDPRVEARWDGALDELVGVEALKAESDSCFRITALGYQIVERHNQPASN